MIPIKYWEKLEKCSVVERLHAASLRAMSLPRQCTILIGEVKNAHHNTVKVRQCNEVTKEHKGEKELVFLHLFLSGEANKLNPTLSSYACNVFTIQHLVQRSKTNDY